jgi:hypothetical protein
MKLTSPLPPMANLQHISMTLHHDIGMFNVIPRWRPSIQYAASFLESIISSSQSRPSPSSAVNSSSHLNSFIETLSINCKTKTFPPRDTVDEWKADWEPFVGFVNSVGVSGGSDRNCSTGIARRSRIGQLKFKLMGNDDLSAWERFLRGEFWRYDNPRSGAVVGASEFGTSLRGKERLVIEKVYG